MALPGQGEERRAGAVRVFKASNPCAGQQARGPFVCGLSPLHLDLVGNSLPMARPSAKTYSFSNTSDRVFRPCRISGLGRGSHGGFMYTRRAVVAADLFQQLADAGAADVVGQGQVGNRPPTPAVPPQRF